MNIELWKSISGFVELDQYPNLPCPYCHQEALNLDPGSIVSRVVSEKYKKIASRHFNLEIERQDLADSKQIENVKTLWDNGSAWGMLGAFVVLANKVAQPDYDFCQFTAFMKCSNCDDAVAVSGLSQEHLPNTKDHKQHRSLYKVDHFSIPIPMFDINTHVPPSIQFELLGAFSYFHIDTNSSANKLRRAMEKFCSELGAEGNNLARKINNLEAAYPIEVELLNTLRLVGNEGTHSDGVLEDDLLLAFDIFEEVLMLFPRIEKLRQLKEPQNKLINKFDKNKAQSNLLEHTK